MIIPALDLIDGKVVRLYQGDYRQQTTYGVEPTEQFRAYQACGSSWLHLVDLSGARDPAKRQFSVISRLAEVCPLNLQIGGGIRSEADLLALLEAGADRVVIGSLAVLEPERVRQWLHRYGPEKIVLALDLKPRKEGGYGVAIAGWQQECDQDLNQFLDDYLSAGLRHLLCTDISRDGTLQGSNIELYRDLCRRFPALKVQSSGGIGSLNDIQALRETGVNGVIVGRALLDGRFTLEEAIECWQNG
ncbi:1-(5-phosphoribosyl)-5-[(5-phosphoribosylamino)methylideneamino]imidazole-4-carboxamide isomerase [Dongshaea marina]|uniref:1-(5-phosphoribosyl)-5-[(5- phosphoribosylamino)methylideneamino]imidazole-4- carboxamide isomerase n=1 Tax=Dongshaea marina TaxID=2047966 RepID=UPI000D3E4F1B|nr:1-(5-phosphoribosyl)-5-[(5-phosphoribosylamino)methylideneamino]imidazole-4-carboxamide isomerase [Dongshaea marina]